MKRTLLAAALLGALGLRAEEAPAPKLAPMWSVHVDELEPSQAARFDEAVGKEGAAHAAIRKEFGVPPSASVRLVESGFVERSFRPRASFTDFDKPSPLPEAAKKRMAEASAALEKPIHEPLVNHHNEVWWYDRDSSFWLAGRSAAAPAVVHLHSEWTRPAAGEAYGKYQAKLREALVKLKSPVSLLVFDANYGDGATKYLWCAESRAQLEALGEPARILERAFGAEEAAKAVALWRAALVRVADADATPCPDLEGRDAVKGWFLGADAPEAKPAP